MSNLQQLSLQFNEEIWKPVKGFEERFYISSLGRLRSHDLRKNTISILKCYIDTQGYFQATLRKKPVKRKVRIHTLVAENFLGKPVSDERIEVNHKDGNKLNNNLSNLEWTTSKGNTEHAVETGLMDFKGSKHPQAKVNEKQVLEMRGLYADCTPSNIIAIAYGLSRRNTSDIVKRRLWKHI